MNCWEKNNIDVISMIINDKLKIDNWKCQKDIKYNLIINRNLR